jgi:hypothetical protein
MLVQGPTVTKFYIQHLNPPVFNSWIGSMPMQEWCGLNHLPVVYPRASGFPTGDGSHNK